MVANSVKSGKLQTEFALLVNAGSDVSTQLELGQAETPLTDGFCQLVNPTTNAPLTISLLSLDESSAAMMDEWLSQAIQVDVCSVNVEQLLHQPNVYQQFCKSGHLLMVAGKSSHRLTDVEAELLNNLTSNFAITWPTVIGERKRDSEAWWQQAVVSTHVDRLDPLFLQATSVDGGGDVLANPACPLRGTLLFERQARMLQSVIANLNDRQQREVSALQERKKLLEKQSKPNLTSRVPVNDKEVARIREQFAEELTNLEKQIILKSDRAVQPLGKLTNLMRENATCLSLEDLDKEEAPAVLKLSVNGSHLATVNRKVEHALRQELSADVGTIQDRVQHLTAQASVSLQSLLGEQVLTAPPLQESSIWRTVENLLAIGKESHIELARKGFFDVLTAGRQKVFILIMFVSLMGRMGLPNLFQTGAMRSFFGLFMLSVLVGSMVSAIFTWRRERESQSEKEMFKIKESLFNDGTKVIEQVEKGKLIFLRDYLKDVNKKFDQQLKRVAEAKLSEQKNGGDLESQRRDANRKKLDTREKFLTDMGRQINKLTADARSLQVTAIGATREAAREHITVLPSDAPSAVQSPAEEPTSPVSEAALPTNEPATQPEPVSAAETIAPMPQESPTQHSERTLTQPAPRVSALAQRREARRKAREANA